jgi:ABC-type antimicrobial peptide transport system permease subunit
VALQRGLERVAASIISVLTLLSLALASVGIYGVMAFLVRQRTREIGIRMALGADSRSVVRSVVLQGLRPVLAGVVCGFAAAIALDAWDRSTDLVPDTMLHSMFGDPIIYGEIVFMLAVALLASALPARRATQVDPVLALRHD